MAYTCFRYSRSSNNSSIIQCIFLLLVVSLTILLNVPVIHSMAVVDPIKMNGAGAARSSNAASVVQRRAKAAKIAVIGAGAAGLAAARVASRQIISGDDNSDNDGDAFTSNTVITVFEKDPDKVGGIWQHQPKSSTKPMYTGLRTNLPKEVMQYREQPWKAPTNASFLRHDQVAKYLQDYSKQFNLLPLIKFGTNVKQLTMINDIMDGDNSDGEEQSQDEQNNISVVSPTTERWPKIRLEWETTQQTAATGNDRGNASPSTSTTTTTSSDIFDAVFICNGHYAKPSQPDIPGLAEYYKGKTMHSVAYDDPKEFSGKTVLCIGGRASGSDLAREISFFANKVYLSDTTCPKPTTINSSNDNGNDENSSPECPVVWVPKTVSVRPDGSIQFEGCDDNDDDSCPCPTVDMIIFCSGYDYSFPFINDQSNLDLNAVPGERRVSPLYEELWHAEYPNVAFLGLPHSVVPFPLMELQAEATWTQWNAKKFCLPPVEERMKAASVDDTTGGAKKNGRVQDTHFLGDGQWDYSRRMAKLAGIYDDSTETYIAMNKQIYDTAGKARKDLLPGGPDTYRSLVFQRDENNGTFNVEVPVDEKATAENERTVSK